MPSTIKRKSSDEVRRDTEVENDEDIYSEQGREALIDDEDEITAIDEGVMKGYEEEDKLSECQECAKVLKENEDIIETEFEDEIYNFCSEECAEKFERKHKK